MEEKSYVQMRKDFQDTYYKKIVPFLQQFEAERIKTLRSKYAVIAQCVVLSIVIIVYIVCNYTLNFLSVILLICTCAIAVAVGPVMKKLFEYRIKILVMPYVCKCFGNLQWYSGLYLGQYSDVHSFTASNLIRKDYTDSSFDDIFKSSYKDVDFDIVESRFTKTTGTGKNRHTETIFQGVIVKFVMNKNFSGNTIILPDTLMHISPSRNLRRTILEDVEFEKKFDVFTDDEVEARYLITPSFMVRLNNMRTAFGADKVRCAFYDKYLLIGLHTSKDLFSLCALDKPIDDPKQFFTMYEEIVSIMKLIDHFKLDQKIGL